MGHPRTDLTGMTFGGLVVVGFVRMNKHRQSVWRCQCGCGKFADVTNHGLTRGSTTSCGCRRRRLASERTKDRSERRPRRKVPAVWGDFILEGGVEQLEDLVKP